MSKGTARRSVRVPQDRWDRAADAARANGETLSDIINRALDDYITRALLNGRKTS